jgi:hypothetical protein
MNLDQVGWLEVAKALGPYVVAIIAMVGTFLSSGLAQRNWQKQFGVQQSVLLLNKRLELASELPTRLFEAMQHFSELLLKTRLSETLNILNSEGRQFPMDAINNLVKEQQEAAKAGQSALNEALKLFIFVKAFFNEQILEEAHKCIAVIQQLNQSQEVASTFRSDLKQCVSPGTTVEQTLVNMTSVMNERLKPANNDMNQQIGKLARLMVEYAKPKG